MITSISVRFREICAIFFSASHQPAIHCNAFVSFGILELDVFCQFWLLLVGSHVPFIISNHCPPKFTTAYQFPDILAAGPPDQGRDPYSSSSKQPWTTITEREHLSISILGLGDSKRCKGNKDGEHLRPNFCQPCAYWHRGCS